MLPHHKLLVTVAFILIFLIAVFTSYNFRRQSSKRQQLGGCTLPKQYSNGENNGNFTHGRTINEEIYISIHCNANYAPYPAEHSICLNNSWSPEFPKCVKTCPAIIYDIVESSCELDGMNEECSKPMLEGTIAHLRCKQSLVISRCEDGYWNNKTALDILLTHCSTDTKSLLVVIKSHSGCVLPQEFANGKYMLTGNYTYGQPIGDETYVRIKCNSAYAPYPAEHSICLNNTWSPEFPRCVRTCPPIISDIVEISCKLNNTKEDCTKLVLEGTIAHMKCKNYYESLGSGNPLSRCVNGSWDIPIIKCTPECGRVISTGKTAIIDGVRAVKGNFPWHVAVYRKRPQDTNFTNICGGSIISRKVVLSAAHCFARDEDGRYTNASYIVGAGKFYSEYESPLDNNAQYMVVQETLIQSTYGGQKTNYQDDIAIVIVEKPFEITQFVQPVCIDWSNELESLQLRENSNGTVVGWGYTKEEGNPANELQQLTVPYKSRGACLDIVPDTFHRFVTTDKFCAGLTNGSAVCQGDSGGGLVFYWPRNTKYYIRGIVSISPINQATCHSHQLTAYTRITNELLLWISTAESENRFWYSDTDRKIDCILPRKFLHGRYTVFGNYMSDKPLNNGTIVTIQCNATYAPYPASFTICLDNRWSPKFPRCVRGCPAIISDSVDVYCELDGYEQICTKPMAEGTIAYMKCKDSYIPLDIDKSVSLCEGGSWDIPIFNCTAGPINNITPEGCTLPRQFQNGYYTVFGSHKRGRRIGSGYLVKIYCNKNFESYPSNITACLNNDWSTKLFPKCVHTCPALISESVEISCQFDDLKRDCTKPMPDGTVARMKCKRFYQPASSNNPVTRCVEGSWDIPILRCVPECGEEIPSGVPLVIDGTQPKMGKFPWHVAVYRKSSVAVQIICGGSIISRKVVLSAAHCFAVDIRNVTYIVGAGKYYSEYLSPLDYAAQFRSVEKTLVPSTYRGITTNNQDDIAIVIVEDPFEITFLVQPVCIDWDNNFETSQLKENNIGNIVGWGYTETDGSPSNELRQLAVPYKSRTTCLTVVPSNFFRFITTDKFCAGFTNGSAVCSGDSGAGLAFYWSEDRKYYIRGILSIAPSSQAGRCDKHQYAAYTRISDELLRWISYNEAENRVYD